MAQTTTTRRKAATRSNVVDLDAELLPELEAARAAITTRKIKLLGEEFTVVCDVNSYLALDFGDVDALRMLLDSLIHPDDLDRFHDTLSKAQGLTAEILIKIIDRIAAVAADRPS